MVAETSKSWFPPPQINKNIFAETSLFDWACYVALASHGISMRLIFHFCCFWWASNNFLPTAVQNEMKCTPLCWMSKPNSLFFFTRIRNFRTMLFRFCGSWNWIVCSNGKIINSSWWKFIAINFSLPARHYQLKSLKLGAIQLCDKAINKISLEWSPTPITGNATGNFPINNVDNCLLIESNEKKISFFLFVVHFFVCRMCLCSLSWKTLSMPKRMLDVAWLDDVYEAFEEQNHEPKSKLTFVVCLGMVRKVRRDMQQFLLQKNLKIKEMQISALCLQRPTFQSLNPTLSQTNKCLHLVLVLIKKHSPPSEQAIVY